MYTIWRTGHQINDTVTAAFRRGSLVLSPDEPPFTIKDVSFFKPNQRPPASISYGILRGADTIFKTCQQYGVEWWEIDRGYFRPHHYNGYYRISLNNTRTDFNPNLLLPGDRFRNLKLEILPWREETKGHIILFPPTEAVASFFGIDISSWVESTLAELATFTDRKVIVRYKGDSNNLPLALDIAAAHCVIGYNSNALIEALLIGTPAIQLQNRDILQWNNLTLRDVESDALTDCDREKLFHFLAYSQFTLEEFAKGYGWRMAQNIQKYGIYNA